MSIFNYIFIYFYFQEIFAVLGETLDVNLEAKKNILIDFHYKVTMSESFDIVTIVRIRWCSCRVSKVKVFILKENANFPNQLE